MGDELVTCAVCCRLRGEVDPGTSGALVGLVLRNMVVEPGPISVDDTAALVCDRPGMVIGMATKKLTITLDEEQLQRIRSLVEAGTVSSVSGFVRHAVGVALDDVAGWGAILARALEDTGGPLSADEEAWADEVLGVHAAKSQSVA